MDELAADWGEIIELLRELLLEVRALRRDLKPGEALADDPYMQARDRARSPGK